MGSFSYRKPLSPDEVTEPPVDVEVAGDSCPGCGGRLEYEGVQVAYVTGIPPMPRPLTGVELSQGAITQDALRRARGAVGDAYQRLRDSVCASRVVHTDDTRWRVGGEGAFLMAFETDETTVCQA